MRVQPSICGTKIRNLSLSKKKFFQTVRRKAQKEIHNSILQNLLKTFTIISVVFHFINNKIKKKPFMFRKEIFFYNFKKASYLTALDLSRLAHG